MDVEGFVEWTREIGHMPKVLLDMPSLEKEYEHYFNDWCFLRGFANGTKLSISDIHYFLKFKPHYDKLEFLEIVNCLDLTYEELNNEC